MTSVKIKCLVKEMNFASRLEKIKYLNIKMTPPKFVALGLKIY
jgi:hypothetical protein